MISNLQISPVHQPRTKPKAASIGVSPILTESAYLEKEDVFIKLKTSPGGLTKTEAEERLVKQGPNAVAMEKQRGWLWRLFKATRNLLVILLAILATVSFATGDFSGGTVMTLMLMLGVALRFVQESRADAAAAKLKAMISVTAAVVRDGREEEIPLKQLVPGDVLNLCAGDMVPADIRLIASRDLFVAQAALTGESLPVEKIDARELREGVSPLELANVCFLGTSVESGSATAVVVATGGQTYFGRMASSILGPEITTSFDRGLHRFTVLMIQFILVMVPLVFLINGLTKHNWAEAFFFSIAVAVGLTPEMPPMIVSVCLSNGALAMSKKKVIVKRLNLGFMGDGINDAPALRVADVGICVDSGVDIAKELATVILLEKSLMVLEEGVIEGRKVFVNILKYIRMGASSNFGNMFSVLGASAFLPYVPMAPLQVLTNNLLYDFSQVPIPTDNVGPQETAKPRRWEIGQITKFILCIGPISSIFDYTTYFVMLYLFGCWDPSRAPVFQTGWFVESLITQTLIIHVIRTKKIPFLRGRASWPLTITTVVIICIGMWLPYSPLAAILGFTHLPPPYWPILFVTLLCYVILTQIVKMWLMRKSWL
jgi:magnesium-transporting ATPase (P-type)